MKWARSTGVGKQEMERKSKGNTSVNLQFRSLGHNAMITLNLMSQMYESNKPWRTEHKVRLSSFCVRVLLRNLNQ
jgi:hypothetical protein